MNKVILKGNLGKDPEVKTFDWGKVAKFSLATTESYTDKKGEKITNTEWHNIVFKGPVVEVIEKHLKKGSQVLVEGKIVTRTYKDKNQVDHWATEIVCNNFEFCGSAEKPKDQQGEWKKGEKREVGSMSDVSELPGNVTTDEENERPF